MQKLNKMLLKPLLQAFSDHVITKPISNKDHIFVVK